MDTPAVPEVLARLRTRGEPGHEPMSDLVCSARGCSSHADFGLLWNNPSLHTPERRKTWLACPEHREHLTRFLGVRGFLREVVDAGELSTR